MSHKNPIVHQENNQNRQKYHLPSYHLERNPGFQKQRRLYQGISEDKKLCDFCVLDSWKLRNRHVPRRIPKYQRRILPKRALPVDIVPISQNVFRVCTLEEAYNTYDLAWDHITHYLDGYAASDPGWAIANFDNNYPQLSTTREYWCQQLQIIRKLQAITWPDAWHKSTQLLVNPDRGMGDYRFPYGWWYHHESRINFPPQIDVTNVLPNGTVLLPGNEDFDPRDTRVEWFDYDANRENERRNKNLCVWCGASSREHETDYCPSQIAIQLACGWSFNKRTLTLTSPIRFGRPARSTTPFGSYIPVPENWDNSNPTSPQNRDTETSAPRRNASNETLRSGNPTKRQEEGRHRDSESCLPGTLATQEGYIHPDDQQNNNQTATIGRSTGGHNESGGLLNVLSTNESRASTLQSDEGIDTFIQRLVNEAESNTSEEGSQTSVGKPSDEGGRKLNWPSEYQFSEPNIKVFNELIVNQIENRYSLDKPKKGFQTVGSLGYNNLEIESWFWNKKEGKEIPLPRWNPETQGGLQLELKRKFLTRIYVQVFNKEEIQNALYVAHGKILENLFNEFQYG